MSVFTAYLNDNAQTPLDRFVVYMLYKQVCNKHGEKRRSVVATWRLLGRVHGRHMVEQQTLDHLH